MPAPRPRVAAFHRRCARSCSLASWRCPSAPRRSSAWPRSPADASTTTSSPRSPDWPTRTCSTACAMRSGTRSSSRVPRAPATTSSATRCSRRPRTTTSCRASGSDSTAPSPRRSLSAVPDSGAIAAGHWGELAYHWSAARDEPRAFEASVRAGEAAARAFAFADARRHDERALESWAIVDEPGGAGRDRPGRAARTGRRGGLAVGRCPTGRGPPARGRGDARPRRRPHPRSASALERLGRALWVNTETEAALEAHEAAMAVMPTEPPTPELARVLSGYGQILMLLDRWTESLVLCERAVAMAREVGARQVEGHALNTLGLDLSVVGRCAESAAASDAALAIAREVADADDIGRGYVNRAVSIRFCGDVPGAAAAGPRGHRRDGRGRHLADVRRVRPGERDRLRLRARRLGGGEPPRRGEHRPRAGRDPAASLRLVPLGPAARVPGRPSGGAAARGTARDDRGIPARDPVRDAVPIWRARRPRCGAETPMRRSRRPRWAIAESRDREWPRDHVRLYRMGMRAAADRAEVARARRDAAAERAALEEGERHVGRPRNVRRGSARATGPASPRTRSRRRSRRPMPSIAVCSGSRPGRRGRTPPATGAPAGTTISSRTATGATRRHVSTTAIGPRLSAALGEAHAIATRLGAGAAAWRRSRGSRPGPGSIWRARGPGVRPVAAESPDDPFGLTRRERDVLPLLVKGRTNRQIAEELFISENTAGVHVSNILGKLGASSRTEAAGIAARLGLGSRTDRSADPDRVIGPSRIGRPVAAVHAPAERGERECGKHDDREQEGHEAGQDDHRSAASRVTMTTSRYSLGTTIVPSCGPVEPVDQGEHVCFERRPAVVSDGIERLQSSVRRSAASRRGRRAATGSGRRTSASRRASRRCRRRTARAGAPRCPRGSAMPARPAARRASRWS